MPVLGKDATCKNCVFWDKDSAMSEEENHPYGDCHHIANNNGPVRPGDDYCSGWMNQETWDHKCNVPQAGVS